jgi:hypothetical protein
MSDAGRRAGFPQKTKADQLVIEISFVDDLQRHRTLQIDVESLVSDPHATPT